MTEASPTGFPIEVDLGSNGGIRAFATPDEVDEWLNTEQSAWGWFPDSAGFDQIHRNRYRELRIHLDQYKSGRFNQANEAQAMRNLLAAFGKAGYIHSSRPEAKFLAELAKENNVAAAHAWAHLTRQQGPQDIRQAPYGVTRAVLFQLGLSGDLAASQRAALDEVLGDARSQAESLRRERENLASEVKTLLDGFQTESAAEIQQAKEASDNELAEIRRQRITEQEDFGRFSAESEKRLQDLTDTYDKYMALAASVDYWRKSQRSHFWRAIVFGAATLVAGVLGFEVVYRFANSVFAEKAATAKVQYWEVGGVLLVVTLVLWGIRILAKVFVANLHLELDAGARRVMVQTYIALSREGQLPDDKSKSLVLGPLFRHVSAGLIKDEGGPSNLFEVLLRLVAGK